MAHSRVFESSIKFSPFLIQNLLERDIHIDNESFSELPFVDCIRHQTRFRCSDGVIVSYSTHELYDTCYFIRKIVDSTKTYPLEVIESDLPSEVIKELFFFVRYMNMIKEYSYNVSNSKISLDRVIELLKNSSFKNIVKVCESNYVFSSSIFTLLDFYSINGHYWTYFDIICKYVIE